MIATTERVIRPGDDLELDEAMRQLEAEHALHDALELHRAMQRATLQLKIHIQREKLSGQVLNRRTGRLFDSIHSKVIDQGSSVIGIVGTNLVYSRIHEYGGRTRPHLITARQAMALAFEGRDGKMIFRKTVHHPGSNMPMRSFLRSSLVDLKEQIVNELNAAVQRGMTRT